ncbi:shikimate dehydrogenase [Nitrosomonas sp. Nm166]|uniref:shikimate dehydrogenase n=1 Tax=Nitrosomonas sp. Nm166 TaxID=1881054 RepID=UPI0008E0F16D|nr:shikimate dehydrogenase [Nitrosomonas sp. Nm166]SFE97843.1 shikimate dehydrogenase [Nitrosomonas sp. Nm166]
MLDSYAVIGNPVSHSKSPLIHAAFAQQTHQSMQYTAILAPLDAFQATVANFRQQGGKGLNVTVPFKLDAFQLATRLTERATIAQAVNTLKFENDEMLGDNTDGAGLVRDIESNLGISIATKRILLMGAGGAARGVILPLLQQRPSLLAIANRTPRKAEALMEQFEDYGNIYPYHFMSLNEHFDIIINATSASLQGTLPELPGNIFTHAVLAYDMMYGREPTHFLKFAQLNGVCQVADGIGMLVEQAAESFFLWRGIRPQTKPVIAMLKSQL